MRCHTAGMAADGLSKTLLSTKRMPSTSEAKATRSTISEKDRQLLYDHVTQYVELHGRRRSIGEWYLPVLEDTGCLVGAMLCKVCLPWVKGLGMFKTIFTQRFLMCSLKISLGFRVVTATVLRFTLCYQKQNGNSSYLGDIRYHGHDIDILWKEDWSSKTPACKANSLCGLMENELLKAMI